MLRNTESYHSPVDPAEGFATGPGGPRKENQQIRKRRAQSRRCRRAPAVRSDAEEYLWRAEKTCELRRIPMDSCVEKVLQPRGLAASLDLEPKSPLRRHPDRG